VRTVAASVLALVALSACRSGSTAGDGEPPEAVPRCQVVVEAPAGFQPLEEFREGYADHVGVRLGFRDLDGRELHAFAGIPGEFGEGLPPAGTLDLGGGRIGLLSGSGRVWVVEWDEGGVCDPRVALGNGFRREGFLSVLEQAGIVTGFGSR
jgi:hypothetical protein